MRRLKQSTGVSQHGNIPGVLARLARGVTAVSEPAPSVEQPQPHCTLWALLGPVVLSGPWHPKILWGGHFGWFSSPCSPLHPHIWGSLGTPALQPHLSLSLAWLVLTLPPASQTWGSLLRPLSLCPWGLGWMFGSFFSCLALAVLQGARAGWGSSACPGVQPPSSCCLGGRAHAMYRSVCSVGLSDVLSHSWGLFLFKKCF